MIWWEKSDNRWDNQDVIVRIENNVSAICAKRFALRLNKVAYYICWLNNETKVAFNKRENGVVKVALDQKWLVAIFGTSRLPPRKAS